MNLTDLQVELRSLETQLAKLHDEIETMKPKAETEKNEDWETITKMAARNPIVNARICSAPASTKQLIFAGLAYILLQDENDFYNQLLYLSRLAHGCQVDASADVLYQKGMAFDGEDLDALCREPADYHDTFLVEALIIAELSAPAPLPMLTLIADIAEAFHIDKEALRVLALIAKGMLTGDWDVLLTMPVPRTHSWCGKLTEYIPRKWLQKKRKYCTTLVIEKYKIWGLAAYLKLETTCEITFCLQDGAIVKKGDVICTYIEKKIKGHGVGFISNKPEYTASEKSIKAYCNGIVRLFPYKQKEKEHDLLKSRMREGGKTHKYLSIYIISYFDDGADITVKKEG